MNFFLGAAAKVFVANASFGTRLPRQGPKIFAPLRGKIATIYHETDLPRHRFATVLANQSKTKIIHQKFHHCS